MKVAAAPRASLGRYQLVRHLASGGMADVVLARIDGIEGFERHVVIKRIRDEQAADPRFVQMFLDEARLAASLHHHNIVQVHELAEEDGEYFFAMEYVHGEDLRRVLAHLAEQDERMPLDHCVTIGLATAAALHHAHELRGPDRRPLGIVHCDVSPANILVGLDGDVKVIDFGIATVASTTQTVVDLMKGKAAYMSPEQCLGAPIDRRSDVFSLGIVLYELVTVRRLFKGANDFVTMTQITQGEIPPPSELRPDLPPELEAIILRALESDPAARFQTAGELRSALERFASRARLQTSATALADFMRGLFGDRVMPWQLEDDEPEISIDFDGDASGVARAAARAPVAREAPGSLLARARARASTSRETPAEGLPVRALGSDPGVTSAEAADAEVMADADVVALDDDAAEATPRPRRRWRAAVAAAGAAAVVLLVWLATRGGPAASGGDAAPRDDRTAAPPAPVAAEPAPVAAATAPDAQAAVAEAEAVEGATPEAATATTATATGTAAVRAEPAPADAPATTDGPRRAPARRTPRREPPARGVWDPNSLFPPER